MPTEAVDEIVDMATKPDRPGMLQIPLKFVKMINTPGPAVDTTVAKTNKAGTTS